MHGRKKTGDLLSEDEQNAVTAKVSAYRKLSDKLLESRQALVGDGKAAMAKAQLSHSLLDLQGQLLKVNPDLYTLWGHRKELLLAQLIEGVACGPAGEKGASEEEEGMAGKSKDADDDRLAAVMKPPRPLPLTILKSELDLTASCIKRQPKSYSAWHHRLWVIKGHAEATVSPPSSPSLPLAPAEVAEGGAASLSPPSPAAAAAGGFAATAPPATPAADAPAAEPAAEPAAAAAAFALELEELLSGELALCGVLLDLDQRNFHCWAYRLQVARYAKVSVESELAYTLEKITQNFSNYSAFHYRSKIIERMFEVAEGATTETTEKDRGSPSSSSSSSSSPSSSAAAAAAAAETAEISSSSSSSSSSSQNSLSAAELFAEELEMVGNAAYTEPSDQSAWWYHRFLLEFADTATAAAAHSNSEARELYGACLESEALNLRALVDMEPGCKWPLSALNNVLSHLVRHRKESRPEDRDETSDAGGAGDDVSALEEEWRSTVEALKTTDPVRCAYYASLKL